MSPGLPSLLPGQPCSWPNPVSVQVNTQLRAMGFYGPDQALAIERQLVETVCLTHALTGSYPATGDTLHVNLDLLELAEDPRRAPNQLLLRIKQRVYCRVGVNIIKIIFHLA